jgi:hypothetical protein
MPYNTAYLTFEVFPKEKQTIQNLYLRIKIA